MRVRAKCLRLGHDFREFEEVRLPVLFCRRWFCDGSVVAPWVYRESPVMARLLEKYAREEQT